VSDQPDRETELRRELRIHEGVEVVSSFPGVVLAYFFGLVIVAVYFGTTAFMSWIVGVAIALLIASSVIGFANWSKLRKLPRPKSVSKRRIRSLTIASAIQGTVFAFFTLGVALQVDNDGRFVMISMTIIGIMATVGIYCAGVAFAFAIPNLIISVAWVLWTGTMDWLATIVLYVTVGLTITQFILRTRRTTLASLSHVIEGRAALGEQLKAEERLRAAEAEAAQREQERQAEVAETQKNMIDAIAFPMVISNGNDAVEVTPAGRDVYLVSDGPLDNVKLSDFFVNPQDQLDMIAILDEGGTVDNYEVLMKDKSGAAFWCAVSMRPLKYKGEDCWMNSIYVIDARKRMEQDLASAKDAAEEALSKLKTTQESLVHAEKMASLGELTAGIAHEIKNPLNFVNNFSKLSADMLDELAELLEEPIKALNEDDRDDAEDIMATVKSNLVKIDEHGKRADSIVKNMLLHSRQGGSEKQKTAIDPLVEEAINLAYHGARAADSAFNVDITTDFGADGAEVLCLPQELQRVFLNLCSNAMYAAVKADHPEGEVARLTVSTRLEDAGVLIDVKDNGGGIPKDIQSKIFEPFFTTKPTGEGTGLGLSMSFDIIKQHDGKMTVASEVGTGTVFTVRLPLVANE